MGQGASVARARQVRLAAARACGTRRARPRAWARGERGLGRGKGHCWLGRLVLDRLGLDEVEAGPVQGKGEGRGGRAGLGRGKGWAGLRFSFYFLFFSIPNSNKLKPNESKFEFGFTQALKQTKQCSSMMQQPSFKLMIKF